MHRILHILFIISIGFAASSQLILEENDITLIINGQSAIYNAAGIDITSKVVELLNLEP